ncbi:MAG: hypothetical protein R3291_05070, partial [Thermoplasmata archaeon]|nr:hypothetical protein [Thermoplasmata archaeon]
MRVRLEVPLLVLLALAWIALPIAGESVGNSPVRVLPVGEPQTVLLGQEARYAYAIFNGDPAATYMVEPRVLEAERGFSAEFQPAHVFVGPGEDDEFALVLRAPSVGLSGLATMRLAFTALNLSDDASQTLEITAEVTLLGTSPLTDPVGKIFGVWPNPLPPPLDGPVGAFLVTLALWILIALGVILV